MSLWAADDGGAARFRRREGVLHQLLLHVSDAANGRRGRFGPLDRAEREEPSRFPWYPYVVRPENPGLDYDKVKQSRSGNRPIRPAADPAADQSDDEAREDLPPVLTARL